MEKTMAQIPSLSRSRHVLSKIRQPGDTVVQADELALQAARMLAILPRYGVYNKTGMAETRKAICAWLNIPITEEQADDARGWHDFITPHLATLKD
jgi:hypothetical protein